MSVVDGLSRLAQLHDQGHLGDAEYDEAKARLLRSPSDAVRRQPDGAYLLYRLVASWMRRLAAAMAVVALLFGAVASWSGVRYLQLNGQAAAIKDASIARGLGFRIPDPRPSIDRAVLEAKATAYGAFTAGTGLIALGTLTGALLIRPRREGSARQSS